MLAMLASLFLSRVALSVTMLSFFIFSFFHSDIKGHIRNFFSSSLLWGMSLLFFLPVLSGLWSNDVQAWADKIIIKLPLFFMPLAFAAPFGFSKKEWLKLAFVFITLVTAGTIWSMFHYITNMPAVDESYLRAKSILTPLGNDHVRYSWMLNVAILLSAWLWITEKTATKFVRWFLVIITFWLILFLHILAARTGLFSFYLMIIITLGWMIVQKSKPLWVITLFMLAVALPIAAYFILPTFHNRVRYFMYDLNYFKEAHYLPGANDAVRVISLKAGWNVMNEHPVTGVGYGDVLSKTQKWYSIHYPQMAEADKIFPSSEWLMYGAACGWPGLLLFGFIMIVPFLLRVKNKLPWYLLNSTASFSFLFDIGLEVQFGIFIYSFIILSCWKWLKPEKV